MTGAPPFEVMWYKGNEPIQLDEGSRIDWSQDAETGVCTLEVGETTANDGGVYKVVASNDYGTAELVTLVDITIEDADSPSNEFTFPNSSTDSVEESDKYNIDEIPSDTDDNLQPVVPMFVAEIISSSSSSTESWTDAQEVPDMTTDVARVAGLSEDSIELDSIKEETGDTRELEDIAEEAEDVSEINPREDNLHELDVIKEEYEDTPECTAESDLVTKEPDSILQTDVVIDEKDTTDLNAGKDDLAPEVHLYSSDITLTTGETLLLKGKITGGKLLAFG